MAKDLLGESFDIHGGGNDLLFPHHENEIAQSHCAHPEAHFARYWLHNEMLQVEGKKMSKSLGNFFTVRDLLDQGYAGEVIRFVFLSTHYGKPMDWTDTKARDAENTLRKWRKLCDGVRPSQVSQLALESIADDLNTAGAIAELHALASRGEADKLKATAGVLGLLQDQMGAWATSVDLSPWETKLTKAREKAMESKDFAQVDRLKSGLIAAGIDVRMSKSKVELVPLAGFHLDRLKDLD